jgi:hypothetical protein
VSLAGGPRRLSLTAERQPALRGAATSQTLEYQQQQEHLQQMQKQQQQQQEQQQRPAPLPPPPPPRAYVWGLVDARVVRGLTLAAHAPGVWSLTRGAGWNPLTASTAGSDSEDEGEGAAGAADGAPATAAAITGAPAAVARATAVGWDHELRVDGVGRAMCRGWNKHGEADPAVHVGRVRAWCPIAALALVRVVQVAAGEGSCFGVGDALLAR